MKIGERVYQTLRRQLMVNHYEPGAHLREEVVAEQLGVSRTPVRNAFQRLISEGLLSHEKTRGAIVTGWRKSDTEDIFKLRILLEGHAAALAAHQITSEQFADVVAANDQMREAIAGNRSDRIERIARANQSFHEGLLDASGQGYLRMFARTLLHLPMVSGFFIYSREEMDESVRQHQEIIAALQAGNEEWAKAAMTSHLNGALERFRRSR
ncbi:DNA-binding GntR family transcriptional regulator [Halomonas fontilapidosi]|uniref:DNA-binding GntR family transcriptional regulator n=1 Tax=Halomonas fontilapidosi TaxID=616675 RepID=A0A7W5H002_9GAMM|nr:GntR family transcriptional regulator [Halomonas fontilapidosi]MBB3184761.1 DNA-binding GntR family transcriptional regulator [Halomonas fontilapidosi]